MRWDEKGPSTVAWRGALADLLMLSLTIQMDRLELNEDLPCFQPMLVM